MELLHLMATTHPTRVMQASAGMRGVRRPAGGARGARTGRITTGVMDRVRAVLTRRPGSAAPVCTAC